MGPIFAAALRSRIAALGIALTTASALTFLVLVGLDLLGLLRSPYAGLLVFILVPALFVLGLALIPLGLWRERRGAEPAGSTWPKIDLSVSGTRSALIFVATATLANVALLSFASYGAVEYSETTQFCGQSCHVMEPHFVAHQNGPHGRVSCVSCHVEPGAQGFLKAKLNGTRQLVMMATHRYPTPIPSPTEAGALPSVQTSCEQCHRPNRFIGDVVKVVYEYADDQANTESKTTLRLHVGGPISGTGSGVGIHWHMNRGNNVEYIALDAKLEQIPYVRVSTHDGRTREYFAEGVNESELAGKPRRQMGCTDCHSRPAHRFGWTPERSVDAAIGAGLISARLPFVRREAVRALGTEYPSQEVALANIERTMRERLQPGLPADSDETLRQAIAATQNIYRTNIFPAMKVGWGTYGNRIGHMETQGCFRCHDENHKTKDGLTLAQNCESCHAVE